MFKQKDVVGDSNCGWYSIAEYIHYYKENEAWLTLVLKDADEKAKVY